MTEYCKNQATTEVPPTTLYGVKKDLLDPFWNVRWIAWRS
jgi:hypothetical protein